MNIKHIRAFACTGLVTFDRGARSVEFASSRTRFRHINLRQDRQSGFDPLPKPEGDPFCGRILQTLDLVQVIMIQSVHERLNDLLDLGKIDEPSGLGIDLPGL